MVFAESKEDVIDLVKVEASVAVMNEDYASAMSFMARLRPAASTS